MTVISVLTTQNVPATFLNQYLPTLVDLSTAGWVGLSLQIELTTGTSIPTPYKPLHICYAFSNTNLGSPPNVSGITSYQTLCVFPSYSASSNSIFSSEPIIITGSYLYIWINNSESLNAPLTISISVNQVVPSMANTNMTLGNSNVRFVADTGWQFYDTDDGLWHTLLCVGSPPSVAFDAGTST